MTDNKASKQPTIGHNSRNFEKDKATILFMLTDFAEDPDRLGKYLDHIGFDISAISDPKALPDAFVAHYRVRQGEYDIDRASHDLLTFPPIAARVFQLMEKQRQSNKTGV